MENNDVSSEAGCPCCGNVDVDTLVWDEDMTVVTCYVCEAVYDPSESYENDA